MDLSIHARISQVNLKPFLTAVSYVISYDIDESDWVALEHGAKPSGLKGASTFSYPLGGIEVVIGYDSEDSEYEVEIRHARDFSTLATYVAAAEFLCSEYKLILDS